MYEAGMYMHSCGWLRRYVCALTSCMLQASYLLLVEKSGAEKGIGSTELLYYNALLSLPFILGVGRQGFHDDFRYPLTVRMTP